MRTAVPCKSGMIIKEINGLYTTPYSSKLRSHENTAKTVCYMLQSTRMRGDSGLNALIWIYNFKSGSKFNV